MTCSQSDPGEVHGHDVRLSYADTDPAGILYFAVWFPWMERIQSEWLYLQGLRQDMLQERFGFTTVTRHADCEYLSPVGLFDEIRISMSVSRIGRTSFTSSFRMRRIQTTVVVATGSLTVVCLDAHGQPVPVPDPLRALLDSVTVPPDHRSGEG